MFVRLNIDEFIDLLTKHDTVILRLKNVGETAFPTYAVHQAIEEFKQDSISMADTCLQDTIDILRTENAWLTAAFDTSRQLEQEVFWDLEQLAKGIELPCKSCGKTCRAVKPSKGCKNWVWSKLPTDENKEDSNAK